MRLQYKLLLVVIPLIVGPIMTLSWIGYEQIRTRLVEKTLIDMKVLVEQAGGNVSKTVDAARANLDLFANAAQFQRYMLIEDEESRYSLQQPALLRLFASYQEAFPSYVEIRVLLPDGYEDTRATRGEIPNKTEDEAGEPWFRELAEGEDDVIVQFGMNRDLEKPALLVARKIKLRDPSLDPISTPPTIRGYLAITVELSAMDQLVQTARIRENGRIFFMDQQGRVLLHSDPGQAGVTMPPEILMQLRAAVRDMSALRVNLQGQAFYVRGKELPGGIFIFGTLPEAELLTASRTLNRFALAVTLAAIVFTAALMLLFLRRIILRPINVLRNAVHEFGRGNLGATVEVKSRDEFGDLARSFMEMAQSLSTSNDKICHMAYHDSLTGLPNRTMFREFLQFSIEHSKRSGRPLAVLFLDLDNFKMVNDTLGHQMGDELLREVSRLLRVCLRRDDFISRPQPFPADTTDMVARLGGDEFLIMIVELETTSHAESVARRILSLLAKPMLLGAHEFRCTGSIGITLCPADGDEVDKLIKNADIAMYHAKAQGKNSFRHFSDEMNQAMTKRLMLEGKLRRALERGDFVLWYQPLLDGRTGAILGFEALVRWQDPESGLIPPGAFIPIAEETGLIVPLGEWVLAEACRQTLVWQDAGFRHLSVSVNFSTVQFRRSKVADVVEMVLRQTGFPSDKLDVELTESAVMEKEKDAVQILKQLKKLGVSISLDDFGTGYSSLSYLRRFPIDRLKIDRSFLRNLPHDSGDAALVSAIIAMARSLQIGVVAEGVETAEQVRFLREKDCDILQGYFLGKPVPAAEVKVLLASPLKAWEETA